MNINSPVIIFGSNAKLSSASIARLQHLKEIADESYSAYNDFHESIEPIFTYTTEEIFEALERYKNRVLAFHFEGRTENYESLLQTSNQYGIKNLPARLGDIPKLGYVFLSGCAQDKHINDLLNRGVPAVITSSKRLSNQELSLFAETIHKELGQGKSIEDAYNIAKESLGVVDGQKQRIFIHLRGLPKARHWRLPAPDRIIGVPDTPNNANNDRSNISTTTSPSRSDQLKVPSTILNIDLNFLSDLTTNELLDNLDQTLNSLNILYSLFAVLHLHDQSNIKKFVKSLSKNNKLYRQEMEARTFLAELNIEPLHVKNLYYGSGSISLFSFGDGISKVIDSLRELIKDVTYRVRHEHKVAKLEEQKLQVEIEKEKNSLQDAKRIQKIAQKQRDLDVKIKELDYRKKLLELREMEYKDFIKEKQMIRLVDAVQPALKVIASNCTIPNDTSAEENYDSIAK